MLKDFEEEQNGDITIININVPDATLKHAANFKKYMMRLIESDSKKVLINCANISYMDSTFLGSLVFSLKKMATVGGQLKLILGNVESPVWTMFETTRMFRVFKTYPDIETALESFE